MKRIRLFPKKRNDYFEYLEAEREREKNRMEMLNKFEEERYQRRKTQVEQEQVLHLSIACTKLMSRYQSILPEEDVKTFFLCEELTAFLPLTIKKHLKPRDSLIMFSIQNPLIQAKIKYV